MLSLLVALLVLSLEYISVDLDDDRKTPCSMYGTLLRHVPVLDHSVEPNCESETSF
jgi:hypothetical protein